MSRLRYCFSFKGCIARKQFIIGCICTCGIVLLASYYIFNNLVYCAIALISLIAFSSFAVRRMHDIHKPVKIFVAVIVIFVSMSAVSAYYKNQGINYFITSSHLSKEADNLSSKNTPSKPKKFDAAGFHKDTELGLESFKSSMADFLKRDSLRKKSNRAMQKSKDYMLTADMIRYSAIVLITIFCVLLASIKSYQGNSSNISNSHSFVKSVPAFRKNILIYSNIIMFIAICVLSGFVYSQHNDINKLRNDIATINKDSLKKLHKQISDNESEISGLHSKINDTETCISDNENVVNDPDNSIMQSQVHDLQRKIDNTDFEISTLRRNQK